MQSRTRDTKYGLKAVSKMNPRMPTMEMKMLIRSKSSQANSKIAHKNGKKIIKNKIKMIMTTMPKIQKMMQTEKQALSNQLTSSRIRHMLRPLKQYQ